MIRVQQEDFSLEQEYLNLQNSGRTGATVVFVGTVREFDKSSETPFYLQHYPGMTERVLDKIEQTALSRWSLLNTVIIHRIGKLKVDDQIVLVGASSAHREDAFAAANYMIDVLKTEAPFWKKEGIKWVDANADDQARAERWLQK